MALFILIGCNTVESEESGDKQVQSMQLSIEDSIINRYLPEQVSEKRDTPITHVLLHFSSNAQNKPDNPYQIEDTFEVHCDGQPQLLHYFPSNITIGGI
ncbi:hypothetical protein [Paucisalibacillus globulus]|uniref:hypothetical protein n=1 Tax=Paucisalibacillus globulus TaxID=351095 RepID=UPI000BB70976|nr:hypothetical protein [Paucisalibacillus globulus]